LASVVSIAVRREFLITRITNRYKQLADPIERRIFDALSSQNILFELSLKETPHEPLDEINFYYMEN